MVKAMAAETVLKKYADSISDPLLKLAVTRYSVQLSSGNKKLEITLNLGFSSNVESYGYSFVYSSYLMFKELAASIGGKLTIDRTCSSRLNKGSASKYFECYIESGSAISITRYVPMMLMLAKKHLSSDRVVKKDQRTVPYTEQLELGIVDLNSLPKSEQLKRQPKSTSPSKSKVKGFDYSNTPDKVMKAIKAFVGSKNDLVDIAKQLDASSDVKATLRKLRVPTSGYLYTYFPAFFAVCLMKDKSSATDAIIEMPSLLRQFNAFTVGWSALTSGAFLSGYSKSEAAKIEKAWEVISEAMPKLLPLSQDQVDAIVGIRGTLSFKNYLKNHYTEV